MQQQRQRHKTAGSVLCCLVVYKSDGFNGASPPLHCMTLKVPDVLLAYRHPDIYDDSVLLAYRHPDIYDDSQYWSLVHCCALRNVLVHCARLAPLLVGHDRDLYGFLVNSILWSHIDKRVLDFNSVQ